MNKLRIKKLGILSAAKMYALVMLAVSLIFSVPFGFIMMVSGAAMMGNSSGISSGGGGVGAFGGGLVFMIGVPIFYTAIGFVAGAIGALIYNLFAGIIGGVEIEVENIH